MYKLRDMFASLLPAGAVVLFSVVFVCVFVCLSVEHSARSSQEPQSDSYNFHEPS